ncbi:hypothetical protein 2 [Hubei picorna-like virus 20]|uniref:hypothetical protein 2 n=1 Tax=Hubei picorna-like virus 20 TaxID=1923100 RepID=UPI0009098C62|nr:hypothetical protein 2 [Hubei picorna-like virus 20]APG78377.1 hypothetical protein 2 [Hubei picorna-like virus 20]
MKSMNDDNDMREGVEICDQIQSVAIDAVPESTGVTTFVQEACTAIAAVEPSLSRTFYAVQTDLQDVREYFRRPICIKAGTIGAPRGRLHNVNSTMSGFLGLWTNGLDRLRGAYGIRAKMVVTLQVAATPFHSGLICLNGQYGLATSTAVYDRTVDPCTSTNLPCVILDLSSDTSVQLHLPYLSTGEYSDIRGTSSEPGYIQIALNTLTVIPSIAGMGPPTYQLYLHLEDIELFGATPQAISTVVLTAGRKLSPVTEEFEKDSHPFSSALYASSKAVSFIAKGVPSISSIGGPVSWALGKAAGIVRYFGYGKPAVTDPLMRILRQDNIGEFNTDVASALMVVAATATNTTSINNKVGYSDVDEMSLAYVTSRWGQICVFDLATSAAVGTLIYATPICPLAFWFRYRAGIPAANKIVPQFSTATSNCIQPSHLMFAASSFKQWRGGIKFRFTFVKTKMHAGRVMVNFNPYHSTTTNTSRLTSATAVDIPQYGVLGADPFGYSAIFDLKDGNVFEFKVPYVSPVPYANLATITGALAMYVVNPVIASSVVSSTISVVVEVAGDSDFELANPAGLMFPVHNGGTISLQAGRVLSEAPEIVNSMTMGESITSVKQLIGISGISLLTGAAGADFQGIVPPWFFQPTPSVLTPAPAVALPTGSFHYGGNWASCYSFMKGGTDVHIYDINRAYNIAVSQFPSSGGYNPNTRTPDNRSSANTPVIISSQGSVHARLPAYFSTSRMYSWVANLLVGTGAAWLGTNPYGAGTTVSPLAGLQAVYAFKADFAGTNTSGISTAIYFNTNAADDAQLAMYIGPPPVYLPPSPAVAGPYDSDSTFIQGN